MNKSSEISSSVIDAENIKNALSSLLDTTYRLKVDTFSLKDAGQLIAIVSSIECLATKHAKELENIEEAIDLQ